MYRFHQSRPFERWKENILVLTDAFTKFSQAFVTPNWKGITIAKILVDKWFYTYGIPAHIHSNKGCSFDNEIMSHLCAMYGVEQSTTMPHNPCGNAPTERLNCTLIGLLKSLLKEQKSNWPLHLPLLVFAYNATPHDTTGYQPYELMFGHKAPTMCDSWLGLGNYNDNFSQSKCTWVNQQPEGDYHCKNTSGQMFYTYGIPAHIHSNKGCSFDNEIMSHLCAMYGVEQSTTMPHNPCGNAPTERLNCTLIGLLKSLLKEQKSNWPLHLPLLVFAYNATPHDTTGYQPYELMFGHKAPTMCDSWLGLGNYNDNFSQSKCTWVNQQHELILAANRWALKRMKTSAEKSVSRAGGKALNIPIGNLVLLRDHPEGRNKIQDKL